jgi:hypothetical protein
MLLVVSKAIGGNPANGYVGLTDDVRDMTGANTAVDKSSSAHTAGVCTGVA